MRITIQTLLVLYFLYISINSTLSFAQVAPDFLLIANAGGGEVWQDYSSLRIDAQGNATFAIYSSRDFSSERTNLINFTLTTAQLNNIWQAVTANNFFNLDSLYTRPAMVGRSFARLSILNYGIQKNIITRNIAVPEFDNIMNSINENTPEGVKLLYDISEPPEIIFNELCNGPAAFVIENSLYKNKKVAAEKTSVKKTESLLPSHPGTTLGCELSLEEAVSKGLVELGSKGEFEGDAVSVKVTNENQEDCNQLTLKLALEFYGENASYSDALRIQNAIQEGWEGYTTTDGKELTVLVDVQISPGAIEAPGTPGYHQIELVDGAARSYVDEVQEVNQGTGSGKWERNTSDDVYAHEAGHLMGLEDQYDEYNKLPDGTWEKVGDGEIITSEELAQRVDAEDPTGRTYQEILDKISDPDFTNGSVSKPGHWDDLMGNTKGAANVTPEDIDDITADPGVIVNLPAGSTFINESSRRQNMASTRNDYMFTGPGETRQLDGVYATCIDGDKSIPSQGFLFDLGPHLSQWNGIESAQTMLKLLNYISDQKRYCKDDIALYAAWRVSDNYYVGDQGLNDFFTAAGIQPINGAYDFPRMTSPSANAETEFVIPHQLFVSKVIGTPEITTPGTNVSLISSFEYPSNAGTVQTNAVWSLERPAESTAEIISMQSESASFTPDVRGIYTPKYNVSVLESDNFEVSSKGGAVVAADEWTETFESGILTGNTNINWVSYGDLSWRISEFAPHTGSYCAESGAINDTQQTFLRINLIVPSDGVITFAYKVSSQRGDSLFLLIDDFVVASWSDVPEWQTVVIPISAGAHFVTWVYSKDDFDSKGLDRAWIDDVFFPPNSVLTSVSDTNLLEASFKLNQNFPNPFNPSTEISFYIPEHSHVNLKVYDMLGREVAELLNEEKQPGSYEVFFNALNLSSGIYFYKINAGNFSDVKRMVLLK